MCVLEHLSCVEAEAGPSSRPGKRKAVDIGGDDVILASPPHVAGPSKRPRGNDKPAQVDEDIAVLNDRTTNPNRDLPHRRETCATYPFHQVASRENSLYCDKVLLLLPSCPYVARCPYNFRCLILRVPCSVFVWFATSLPQSAHSGVMAFHLLTTAMQRRPHARSQHNLRWLLPGHSQDLLLGGLECIIRLLHLHLYLMIQTTLTVDSLDIPMDILSMTPMRRIVVFAAHHTIMMASVLNAVTCVMMTVMDLGMVDSGMCCMGFRGLEWGRRSHKSATHGSLVMRMLIIIK